MKEKFKFWMILTWIIIFAAGLVGGIYSERYLIQQKHRERERPRPHFPTIEMMAQELSLSAEQQQKIKEIFEKNEERFKELRGQMNERLMSIRSQLKIEIESVLTPEQKQKFEAMIERYLAQRRQQYEKTRERLKNQPKEEGKGEKK